MSHSRLLFDSKCLWSRFASLRTVHNLPSLTVDNSMSSNEVFNSTERSHAHPVSQKMTPPDWHQCSIVIPPRHVGGGPFGRGKSRRRSQILPIINLNHLLYVRRKNTHHICIEWYCQHQGRWISRTFGKWMWNQSHAKCLISSNRYNVCSSVVPFSPNRYSNSNPLHA